MIVHGDQIDLTDEERIKRNEFIAGLRGLTAWYEAHPGIIAPYCGTEAFFTSRCFDKHESAAIIRRMGSVDKLSNKDCDYIELVRRFGGGVQFRFLVEKELTCQRVKVGTQVLPAEPAKPEREIDVYEWQCNGSVLESLQTEPVGAVSAWSEHE